MDRTRPLSAVVLAAGSSARMGEDKMLLPLRGRPMIWHTIDAVMRQSPERLAVVVRPGAEELLAYLEGLGLDQLLVAVNPDPSRGMKSSLDAGLEALSREGLVGGGEDPGCVVMALGDQPNASAELVSALLSSFAASECDVVIPRYDRKKGHPVVFSQRVAEASLSSGSGLQVRDVLHRFSDSTELLDCSESGVVEDIDTKEDYMAMKYGE